jgi:glycosyltransferase involved in cell wall biosynthesis
MSALLLGRELICPGSAGQAISYELSRVLSTFSHEQVKIFTLIRRSWLDTFKEAIAETEYSPTYYIDIPDDNINVRHDVSLLCSLAKNIPEDADVIIDIDFGISGSLIPLLIRKSLGKKIRTIKVIFMRMNRSLIASSTYCDSMIVTSPLLYGMVNRIPLLRGKVHYIPPPIDTNCFSPHNGEDQLRKESLDQTVISYVGPINPKRFALIETLKAMNLLVKKIDFKFTIFTFFRFQDDANTYQYVQKLIEKLHLKENVKIKNALLNKEEKAQIYRNSTLCLFPISSFELADPSISILEAMASGSIVIASPVNSIPLILKNDFSGFIVNKLEANHLSNLIQHIVGYPEKTRIRKNASKTILDHFSYCAVWKKLNKLIEK